MIGVCDIVFHWSPYLKMSIYREKMGLLDKSYFIATFKVLKSIRIGQNWKIMIFFSPYDSPTAWFLQRIALNLFLNVPLCFTACCLQQFYTCKDETWSDHWNNTNQWGWISVSSPAHYARKSNRIPVTCFCRLYFLSIWHWSISTAFCSNGT